MPLMSLIIHVSDVCDYTWLINVSDVVACAFWMIFGGDKIPESSQNLPGGSNETVVVQGMHDPNALAFSLFRLTLVDDYDYDVSNSNVRGLFFILF